MTLTRRHTIRLTLALLCCGALILASYLAPSLEQFLAAAPPGSVARPDAATAIRFWQKRIAANPQAYIDLTLLGEAYVRQARAQADLASYERAEEALRRALEVNPRYAPAVLDLAGVRYALHDFSGAIALARPLTAGPQARAALALIGEAAFALGDYTTAEATLAQLAVEPLDALAASRFALLAELRGDPTRAAQLMEQAAAAAADAGEYAESLAWYHLQAGEIRFRAGHLDSAEAAYRMALRFFDGYLPAMVGLGKVAAARGDLPAAIEVYEQAVATTPQPDYLAALGDLYALAGRSTEAERQYQTVEYIGQLSALSGAVYNRQLALFLADHDRDAERAYALAVAELEQRRDVYGLDVAAWAAYRSGRLAEAQALIDEARALGTRDALLLYHAGMIAAGAGDRVEAARLLQAALDYNPGFSPLQARTARAYLAQRTINDTR